MLSAFCVLAGMDLVWSTQVVKHFGASCHGLSWSTQVEMHFVSSLTLDEAGQPVGMHIGPGRRRRRLFNTYLDTLCVLGL
jgi:hypothetical protein